jgi:hypothetical protein
VTAPPSAGPGPGPDAGPQLPVDSTAPLASATGFRKGTDLGNLLGRGGAPFEFTLSEAGAYQAELLADAKVAKGLGAKTSAKKYVVLAKVKRVNASAGKQKVIFKLSKKARKKLRKVRKLKVTVRLTLADPAGNLRVVKKPLTLKR